MGVYAGLRPDAPGCKAIMTGSILGFSLPNFWVGLMLIMVFAGCCRRSGWPPLPAWAAARRSTLLGVPSRFLTLDGLRHLLLPAITLSFTRAR